MLQGGRRGDGGPVSLSRQAFRIGINDALSPGFNQRVFTLFDAWRAVSSADRDPYGAARAAVYRGQEIFNTRQFTVRDVRGVNDALGAPALSATCTTLQMRQNCKHVIDL